MRGGGSKAICNFSVWYRLLSLTSIITCIIICSYFFFHERYYFLLIHVQAELFWEQNHLVTTRVLQLIAKPIMRNHPSRIIRVLGFQNFGATTTIEKYIFYFSSFLETFFTKLKSWIHTGKNVNIHFALLLCSRNFFSFSKHFRSPPRSPQVISSRLQIIAKPFCETTVGCIFYYSCTGDCCNNIVQKNKPEAGIFFRGKNEEVQHKTFSFLDSMKQKGHPKILLGYLSQKDPSMQ